jgi:hypothetical protein
MIMPNSRVMVFDRTLYKDDKSTPLSVTVKPATVLCRYGRLKSVYPISQTVLGPYPDLVDVKFDHRPEQISHGHFTDYVKEIV